MMMGQGSGIIATADGMIVTNAHVVDRADTITIVLLEAQKHTAKLVRIDKLIGNVMRGAPAAAACVKAGDIVTAINGRGVHEHGQLLSRITGVGPGKNAVSHNPSTQQGATDSRHTRQAANQLSNPRRARRRAAKYYPLGA